MKRQLLFILLSSILILNGYSQASSIENLQRATAKEIGNDTRSSEVIITNIKRKATSVTWNAQAKDVCYECDADDMVHSVHLVKIDCPGSSPVKQVQHLTETSTAINYPVPDFDNVAYYYDEATNTLVDLEKLNYHVETKAKGLFGGALVMVIPGSSSKIRFTTDDKIAFIIKLEDARTEPSVLCQLVQLDVNTKNNNNQREYMMKSSGLGHAETNETSIEVKYKPIGEKGSGLYLITLADPALTGEFAIALEKTQKAYGFGIDKGTGVPNKKTQTSNYSAENADKTVDVKKESPVIYTSSPQVTSTTSLKSSVSTTNSSNASIEDEIAQQEARLKELKERKAREEAAKQEAERKIREQAEKAAAEARKKAEEEAARKKLEEELLRAKYEAEFKSKYEAEQKAKQQTQTSVSYSYNTSSIDTMAIFNAVLKQKEEEKKAEEAKRLAQDEENRRIDSIVEAKLKAKLATAQIDLPVVSETKYETATEKSSFTNSCVRGVEAMCRRFISDSLKADWMRDNTINNMKTRFDINHTSEVEVRGYSRYSGEKYKGKWQGKGFLIEQNMYYYDGEFANDNFIKGIAYFKYPNGNRFIGEYENDKKHGFGRFTLSNGNTEIGFYGFAESIEKGICHKLDENGNYYFGEMSLNKREGYGIFVTSKGNQYIGLFKADQLQNGYCVQLDDFGVKTYFEITDFSKKTLDAKEWEKFASEYLKMKLMYRM